MELSVSVLNIDFARLEESIKILENAGVDSLHMDIMDGHFVDNISFGPDIVRTISGITKLPLYSHLMIKEPEKYVDRFFDAGSETVTFHIETISWKNSDLLDMDNIGLSLNPDMKLSALEPYLNKVKVVLLMSVYAGFGGQKFIKSSTGRIKKIKEKREEKGADFKIAVDGGINAETAALCAEAGADEIIVGSYITASSNPAAAVKKIQKILSG